MNSTIPEAFRSVYPPGKFSFEISSRTLELITISGQNETAGKGILPTLKVSSDNLTAILRAKNFLTASFMRTTLPIRVKTMHSAQNIRSNLVKDGRLMYFKNQNVKDLDDFRNFPYFQDSNRRSIAIVIKLIEKLLCCHFSLERVQRLKQNCSFSCQSGGFIGIACMIVLSDKMSSVTEPRVMRTMESRLKLEL
jgi:hypothetical protein